MTGIASKMVKRNNNDQFIPRSAREGASIRPFKVIGVMSVKLFPLVNQPSQPKKRT